MAREFVVVGAGGHAKVVIATIEAVGGCVVRLLDDDPKCWGRRLLHNIVEGPALAEAVTGSAEIIVAIGSNLRRREVTRRFAGPFGTVVHPTAIVHSTVNIAEGTVIFAGAIIQPGATLGRHVIVNTGASIDHDCVLGDYVHVAPGSHLAGSVFVGEGSLIGLSSCALPGASVGTWATVGAGAVVRNAVDAGTTVVGVPARPIIRLS